MVTLLGFFFILANIALMALMVPDLIGPVRLPVLLANALLADRSVVGSIMAIL